jgi:hypothetical protein
MGLTIRSAEDLQAEALAQHKARVTQAIDAHIDAQAKALQYNSAAHIAGYTGSTVAAWAAEAQAFVSWRDACWLAALALLAQAEGSGDVPSVDDVLAALPEWTD